MQKEQPEVSVSFDTISAKKARKEKKVLRVMGYVLREKTEDDRGKGSNTNKEQPEVCSRDKFFNRLLSNNRGLTLIEVLVSFAIIVFAVVGIYLALLYAETQINRNYHDRVATLLASGECNWQYHYRYFLTNREFDPFVARQVIIDEFPEADYPPLTGTMTMQIINNREHIDTAYYSFQTLQVQIVWIEPLLGERVMVVQEDFFW
ncbi:MAG: prepilin-type N-terminal cleavage/methylation domain-containing protein [Candidatus Cloacimonetes bacterium]|nr:prepilin-type N-terminal cleavage/methylation domain-containing protein [Candidatus Cloacimonadota bacterium]